MRQVKISYHKNGNISTEREYYNGKLDGKVKDFYENGVIKFVEEYKNGKSTGRYTSHYPNGEIHYQEFNTI